MLHHLLNKDFEFYIPLKYPLDWEAQWITYDYHDSKPLPVFKKNFSVENPLESVRLHISAPGYPSVTGQLTTPSIPRFLQSTHEETLFVDSELIFKWESEGGSKGRLLGRIPYTELDLRKDSDQIEQIDRNCWSRNEPVYLGDLELKGKGAMWADLCGKLPFPQNYVLTLVGMDANYHEYFVRGEQKDYENLFLSAVSTMALSAMFLKDM